MVDLLSDKDVTVSAPCAPFASKQGYLYANAAEQNRDATTMAEVRLQFPYPPKDCNEATLILQNIDDAIKGANEKLASGVSNRPVKRYLDSYLTIRGEFKNWVNAKQCVQAVLQAEDDAFTAQLQEALNNEKTEQGTKKGVDNLIIFGGLGLLLVTAIVIIVKRSRSKQS